MKRFYKQVSVEEQDGSFSILLDEKPVKTKLGKPLALQHAKLAEAVAEEWRGQGEKIDLKTMPITGFASAALDHLPERREEMTDDLIAYADTDLACMRVAHVPELLARQEYWLDPLIEWMKERFGVTLLVQQGLMPVKQLEGNREILKALFSNSPPAPLSPPACGGDGGEGIRTVSAEEGFPPVVPPQAGGYEKAVSAGECISNWQFIPVYYLTKALGSVVLALAVLEGRLSGEDAFQASRLEEEFQADRWGQDEEAEARAEGIKHEILEACQFLNCVKA